MQGKKTGFVHYHNTYCVELLFLFVTLSLIDNC